MFLLRQEGSGSLSLLTRKGTQERISQGRDSSRLLVTQIHRVYYATLTPDVIGARVARNPRCCLTLELPPPPNQLSAMTHVLNTDAHNSPGPTATQQMPIHIGLGKKPELELVNGHVADSREAVLQAARPLPSRLPVCVCVWERERQTERASVFPCTCAGVCKCVDTRAYLSLCHRIFVFSRRRSAAIERMTPFCHSQFCVALQAAVCVCVCVSV